MKTKVLFIVVIALSTSVFAQRGVRIAYVDMEYILENVEEYKEANNQLNAKVEKWKTEIEQKKGAIEQMRKNLSAEKILLTKELIQEREEEIQTLEKEMMDYQQNRFGPQGDLIIQRKMLVQPIQDQVFNAVQEIAANKKYDFIFDKSADVVMLYSDKRHDISDLILRSINKTKKQETYKPKAGTVTTPEKEKINPETEVKEEITEEKPEEQTSTLDEKQQQKLNEREERKKAYEERKKKILEDREAAKKAKLEERKKKIENNKESDVKKEDTNKK